MIKTLEEMKRGMELCKQCENLCLSCPYFSMSDCSGALVYDMAAYIEELEKKIEASAK